MLTTLAGVSTALGQGVNYRFDTDGVLPSSQGAIHSVSSGLNESSVYAVENGRLQADTRGTGKYSYYVVDRIFNHSFDASLQWRANVSQNDGQGVVVSVASGSYAWNFNLAENGVEVEQEGGWTLVVPMDTRDAFHSYRVEIPRNGAAFDLYVDEVLLYSGKAKEGGNNSATLSWGDTSAQGDGKVDWDYIRLSQRHSTTRTRPALVSSILPLWDQTKAVRSGRTIPLKLQVLDALGANVWSPEVIVQMATNFRYDATLGTSGGFIYNFSTKGLNSGTYNVILNINGHLNPYKLQFQIR